MRLLLFLLLLFNGSCFAQFRNNIWCFGDSSGIDFQNNLAAPTTFKSSVVARGSCASISDSSGNLLFYVYSNPILNPANCGNVFDKNHSPMLNGDSLIGDGWFNEYIILPKNEAAKTFYVFTLGVTSFDGLWYSVIDMNLNNGLGMVTDKNVSL